LLSFHLCYFPFSCATAAAREANRLAITAPQLLHAAAESRVVGNLHGDFLAAAVHAHDDPLQRAGLEPDERALLAVEVRGAGQPAQNNAAAAAQTLKVGSRHTALAVFQGLTFLSSDVQLNLELRIRCTRGLCECQGWIYKYSLS
jgi:hypothetical protein